MRQHHSVANQFDHQVTIKPARLQSTTKTRMKKYRYALTFVFFGMMSFVVSLNIYASSYELLFNRDLPFVSSLTQFNYGSLISTLAGGDSSVGRPTANFVGDNGEPKEIRLPESGTKVALVPAILASDMGFLVRAGTGHYLMTSQSRSGGLGDVVVYTKRDWRSLSNSAEITVDDNIFLDTVKDWRYVYRVIEVVKGEQAENYLAPTSARGSMVMVVEGSNGLEVYRAENISLQNVGR